MGTAPPKPSAAPVDPTLKIVQDATCTFCGCVCDDIDLTVKDNHIVEAKRACVLGKSWFLNHDIDDRPSCLVEGKPASIQDGVERAARILTEAKYPIIYGLSDTTCEAQRVAVGIADWIGGTVDTTTSVCHGPSGMAFQGVGEVTCSLGEIANRGDLIIFWGSNPAESHPRHFTKYSLMPKGMFLPNGRKDRTCILVDVRKTKSAKAADIFIQLKPRSDFEALWVLRALAQDLPLDAAEVERTTGVPLTKFEDMMARMKRAKFGVILFGMGLTMTRGKHLNTEAVLALVRDMNAYTRFVAKPMRGHGNVTGADNVVSWRTGYPFGVNLSRGYPRFNPGEYTTSDTHARGPPG
jgi:formylmethanofuran dehydrogenase subunit B